MNQLEEPMIIPIFDERLIHLMIVALVRVDAHFVD